MTGRSRAATAGTLLVVGLVVLSLANVAVAAQLQTRSADLVIEQPHYVGTDVSTTSANGTPLYRVQGEVLDLLPRNFNASRVQDFGVATSGGTLTYDRAMGVFEFRPAAEGTYRLYWSVQRQVPTTTTVERNNSTIEQTTIEQATVRYEALVRVEGGLGLTHQPESANQATERKAERWEQFNESVHEIIDPGVDTTRAVNEMLRWYKLRKDPTAALTGSFTQIHILLFTSLGGLLTVALYLGLPQKVIWELRRQLNEYNVITSQEGPAKDAIEELEHRERMTQAQNMDPRDVFADDHVAHAWRRVFGETVRDGAIRYLSLSQPRNLLANRLQAMGEAGYVAVVEEHVTPDGGAFDFDDPREVSLVHADELDNHGLDRADDAVRALDAIGPEHSLLDALDWADPTLRAFDLPAADYDPRDVEVTFEEHDLQTLVERYEVDMRDFDDPAVFGQYLREFVATLREHPTFTDDDGRLDEIQYAMGAFLKHAQLLDDRFAWPVMHYHREALERAVLDHDPIGDADDLVERVQMGGEAGEGAS